MNDNKNLLAIKKLKKLKIINQNILTTTETHNQTAKLVI